MKNNGIEIIHTFTCDDPSDTERVDAAELFNTIYKFINRYGIGTFLMHTANFWEQIAPVYGARFDSRANRKNGKTGQQMQCELLSALFNRMWVADSQNQFLELDERWKGVNE